MNKSRNGNFTSSEIVALLSEGKVKGTFGKPALTYIEETNLERRMGRSISNESNARPLTWGKLIERWVFDKHLPLDYTLMGDVTIPHNIIDYWLGSPDATKPETVCDVKSPETPKSFAKLVNPLYDGLEGQAAIDAIRNGYTDSKGLEHSKHPDAEKYFWQLVSNAVLTKSKYAELIVYAPYKSELEEIKNMAALADQPGEYKYAWIAKASDEELMWIPDGGFYKNLNIIRWEVKEEDKNTLTEVVMKAGKLLEEIKVTDK